MSNASRYSKVFVKIWHSKDFRTLSGEAKMLFLYLLTSPHRNMGGFYYLPFTYLCFDVGLDENRVAKAFEELEDRGMAVYDKDAQVVLIKKWFYYNPIENENQAKGLNKQLAEIPKSKLFESFVNCVKEYCKYTETILKGFDIPFSNPSETLPKPYAKPGTVTVTGTGTGDIDICASNGRAACQDPGGSVEAEMVTATPGEQRAKTPLEAAGEKPNKPRPPFTSKKQEQLFDQFWQLYPRKKNKGQAERVWAKLRPNDELFASILAGLERAKVSYDWQKEGGKYIPYPATWLNAKGWEDEYTPVEEVNRANGIYRQGFIKPGVIKSLDEARRNRFAALYQNTES